MGGYGTPVNNNVGVFQGETLSALLFIIYLDGVMQDYQSLNEKARIPRRITIRQERENRNKIHFQNRTNGPATTLRNIDKGTQAMIAQQNEHWESKRAN